MTGLADLVLVVAAAAQAPPLDAVALFKAACMDGQATLDGKTLSSVPLDGLPLAARAVLSRAVENPIDSLGPVRKTRVIQVRAIYRLAGEPELYLLLPPADDVRHVIPATCAVVVHADRYGDGINAMVGPGTAGGFRSPSAAEDAQTGGFRYLNIVLGGFRLAASRLNGWTALSSVPTAGD